MDRIIYSVASTKKLVCVCVNNGMIMCCVPLLSEKEKIKRVSFDCCMNLDPSYSVILTWKMHPF